MPRVGRLCLEQSKGQNNETDQFEFEMKSLEEEEEEEEGA